MILNIFIAISTIINNPSAILLLFLCFSSRFCSILTIHPVVFCVVLPAMFTTDMQGDTLLQQSPWVQAKKSSCIPTPFIPLGYRQEKSSCIPAPFIPLGYRQKKSSCIPTPFILLGYRQDKSSCIPAPFIPLGYRQDKSSCIPTPFIPLGYRQEKSSCIPSPVSKPLIPPQKSPGLPVRVIRGFYTSLFYKHPINAVK